MSADAHRNGAGPANDNRDPRDSDRRRTIENLLVALFVVAFLAGGVWLLDRLIEANRLQDCLAARRKSCLPKVEEPVAKRE